MSLSYKEIRELTEWLEKSAFTAYSLSINGTHLSMSKQQGVLIPQPFHLPSPLGADFSYGANSQAAQAPATTGLQAEAHETPKPPAESTGGHVIISPIVGTYYESANPESAAFVKVGQKVQKGDVLCILEAMKIMNEIVSDVDGVVAEIFASNGDMIEARAPLFRIEV